MKRYFVTLLLALTSVAMAQTVPQGYLTDDAGQIVRSGTGLCWHDGYWTPANAVEGCDPVFKPSPVLAKVSITAESLFDFDKSVIKPEGKAMLANLVNQLDSIKPELIVAIGYTDRIGSDGYNKKLSLRRAQAIQDYLVKEGFPLDTIYVEGKGKSNSVTGNTCKGQVGAKLISCLAPDRRVVIEIIGTK